MADNTAGYGHSYGLLEREQAELLRRAFAPPDVAARVPPVPAVEVSRGQWESIRFILRELASLSGGYGPPALRGALIEGAIIQRIADEAWGIRHLADEWDTDDQYSEEL